MNFCERSELTLILFLKLSVNALRLWRCLLIDYDNYMSYYYWIPEISEWKSSVNELS